MLQWTGLFTNAFEWAHRGDAPADARREADHHLSDFERRALGEPLFSRDAERQSERETPRFATMVMPPYL